MPVCFQLYKKGEQSAATLNSIDEAMCVHFNQPVDPKKYLAGWYDTIGFKLAMGKNWEQIRVDFRELAVEWPDEDTQMWVRTMLKITDWLEENYTSDSWRENNYR